MAIQALFFGKESQKAYNGNFKEYLGTENVIEWVNYIKVEDIELDSALWSGEKSAMISTKNRENMTANEVKQCDVAGLIIANYMKLRGQDLDMKEVYNSMKLRGQDLDQEVYNYMNALNDRQSELRS